MARRASLRRGAVGRAAVLRRQPARTIRSVFRLLGFPSTSGRASSSSCVLIVVHLPRRVRALAGRRRSPCFTLLHELGHAVAARAAGAEAEISLDFLAGYASFHADAPDQQAAHGRRSRSPARLIQIVVSLAVLAAMGVNPLDRRQRPTAPTPRGAIWWAGPVIGLLNLIPVLPLDGGNIALTGLEAVLRRPALREMAIASLVDHRSAPRVLIAVFGRTGFVIFIAFLLIGQLQLLQATSTQASARASAGRRRGAPTACRSLPRRHARHRGSSPTGACVAGDPTRAQRIIVDDLRRPTPADAAAGRRRPTRRSRRCGRSSTRCPTTCRPATLQRDGARRRCCSRRAGRARRRVRRRRRSPATARRCWPRSSPGPRRARRSGQRRCSGCDAAADAADVRRPTTGPRTLHVLDHAPELAAPPRSADVATPRDAAPRCWR